MNLSYTLVIFNFDSMTDDLYTVMQEKFTRILCVRKVRRQSGLHIHIVQTLKLPDMQLRMRNQPLHVFV